MTEPLWTKDEVLAALAPREVIGELPAGFSGVGFDSREISGGELFFAIRGVRMDGHAFVFDALKKGAGAAVVSEPTDEMRAAGPLIVVEDTLKALEALGRAARARTAAKVIGVTGSVGKTTTKEMLALALSALGKTHAPPGSFNNHWGVPLTLARLPRDAGFAVIEMGMNAPGEIAALAGMARPEVAVVTHVAESHIGAFDDLGGIARAKAEIFSGIVPGGAAVINADAPHADLLIEAARAAGIARIITTGAGDGADVRLIRAASDARAGTVSVQAEVSGTPVNFMVGTAGEHMARNALIVLAVAEALGLELAPVMQRLREMRPLPGRGRRHVLHLPGGEALLIDESYNANPASMRAALAVLGEIEPEGNGRRIAVLADMLELGEQGPALHAGLAEAVEEAGVDVLCTVGPLMEHLHAAVPPHMRGPHVGEAAVLEPALRRMLRPGDVILFKGSNGMKLGPLAQALAQAFAPERNMA